MRSRIFAVAFVLVTVAVVASCRRAPPEPGQVDAAPPSPPTPSSSSSDTADTAAAADAGEADGGIKATLHAFCAGAFAADADRMRDKCSVADFTLTQSMGRAAAGVCANDLAIAISRGRADFDADSGRKCVEMLHQKQLAQTSETDTFYQHAPCDRVLVGLQPEGQPCRFSIECKDGLACVGYKVGADGTCKKPPAAKETCTLQPFSTLVNVAASALHHPACAAGAFCDGTTCQPRTPPGKACSKSEACASGLSCVMGKCGLRPGTGTACMAPGDCAIGLWCDHGGNGGPGKCATKRAEGEDCVANEACKGRCDLPQKPDGHTAGKCASVCGSG
jgi:hypothetical protein